MDFAAETKLHGERDMLLRDISHREWSLGDAPETIEYVEPKRPDDYKPR